MQTLLTPATTPLGLASSVSFPTSAEQEHAADSAAPQLQLPLLPQGGAVAARKRGPLLLPAPTVAEDGVAALLPKMKRMRLRPSLGQLRLQREAGDVGSGALSSQVRLSIEPEQLRAMVMIELSGGADFVQLEMSFPPQYPHRPPKVGQISPLEQLPGWQYDGRNVVLARLTEQYWSSAMGVLDIVRDLTEAVSFGCSRSQQPADDIEMA